MSIVPFPRRTSFVGNVGASSAAAGGESGPQPRRLTARRVLDSGAFARAPVLNPVYLFEAAAHLPIGREIALEISRRARGGLGRLELVARDVDEGADALAHLETWLDQVTVGANTGTAFALVDGPAPAPGPWRYGLRPELLDPSAEIGLAAPNVGAADLKAFLCLAGQVGVNLARFALRSRRLGPSACERVRRIAQAALRRGEGPNAFAEALWRWSQEPSGYEIFVELQASAELGEDTLNQLGLSLFGCGLAPADETPPALDLRLAAPRGLALTWRLVPTGADLRAAPPAAPTPTPRGKGTLTLGLSASERLIRLSAADRMMHLFLLGGTGVGKTSLLANLILEDIKAGEGVFVIDPHGDLAMRLRARLSPAQRKRLIWIDPAQKRPRFRLDLFATPGVDPELERSRVANQLIWFMRNVYAAVPEACGPAFEQYFRMVIYLLMLARDPADRTILKFEEVFTDDMFRRRLAEECPDEKVRDFWLGIAADARGEQSIDSFAPYITNKMGQISSNPLSRRFLAGKAPALDLRKAMNEGAIVLVRLAKGELGDHYARFLGMLMTLKLAEAAMSRSDMAAGRRRRFRAYVDEFQNLASRFSADLLAESRKFGLSLILACQSLSQLGPGEDGAHVAHAALANCGSIGAFRCGLADARILAERIGGELCPDELMGLGVGELIVQRLENGAPGPPTRITAPPPRWAS